MGPSTILFVPPPATTCPLILVGSSPVVEVYIGGRRSYVAIAVFARTLWRKRPQSSARVGCLHPEVSQGLVSSMVARSSIGALESSEINTGMSSEEDLLQLLQQQFFGK